MLTVDMLRQNAALAGLPENVLTTIADMSKNDEAAVINTRIGELHGMYDTDIFGISGIAKNSGEKSYDYNKRVLGQYKATIAEKEQKITELNKQIEKGNGDDALKQQLKDVKAQVTQLQTQLTAKDTELATKTAEFDKQLLNTRVDFVFSDAISKLKFKDSIPESIKPVLISSAKNEVLAKGTPDFIDDGHGGLKFVVRGADGNILNNVKNSLNPYTMSELIAETSLKDVIENGRVVTGGGTGGGSESHTPSSVLDLSGMRTQLEADKAIETYLLTRGLTRDSEEFAEQSMQLRTENNIANLPIR